MIRRPPRSTHCISSAASDVYKRQNQDLASNVVRWDFIGLEHIIILMTAGKKSLEVNFKASLWMEKVTNESVKAYLELVIPGLKVTSVELQTAKVPIKAIVSSNALKILLGIEGNKAGLDYRSGKSASVIGNLSSHNPPNENSRQMVELKGEIARLKKELHKSGEKEQEEEEIRKTNAASEREMKILQDHLQDLIQQFTETNNAKAELEEKYEALEVEMKALKHGKVTGTKHKKKMNVNVEECKECVKLRAEKKKMQDNIVEIETRALVDQAAIKGLKEKMEEMSNLENTIKELVTDKEELQSKYKASTETCKELEERVKELQGMYDSKKAECDEYEEQLQGMKPNYESVLEECNEHKSIIKTQIKQYDELEVQQQEMTEKYEAKVKECEELEDKIKELDLACASEANKCAELESKIKEITAYSDSKELECLELTVKIRKLEAANESKTKECAELGTELKEAKNRHEKGIKENTGLKKKLKETENDYDMKVKQCIGLNEKIKALENKVHQEHELVEERNEEITELKLKAKLSEHKANEYKESNDELQSALNKEKEKVTELADTIKKSWKH
eukprot:TRINITY_DN14569_c0_g2_i6.p1 TRINITY_DN14569_c0_g2~~TRINITY_DN14569_c0_g2_i6.p1  ORF type:complete len:577 (+),score=169.14 TRINITY_DN14569_c0_g2_i6:23-1732(+)